MRIHFCLPTGAAARGVKYVTARLPDSWAIGDVQAGFWVTGEGQPTKLSDAAIWVAPSQVRFIVKEETE